MPSTLVVKPLTDNSAFDAVLVAFVASIVALEAVCLATTALLFASCATIVAASAVCLATVALFLASLAIDST